MFLHLIPLKWIKKINAMFISYSIISKHKLNNFDPSKIKIR